MTDGNATKLHQGRRRIIERPRLTRLLNESPARIKMLVAPAGYGKTTLARQWLNQTGRRGVWLQCTPAVSDVAVLLAQIAEASTGLSGDDHGRMLERLRVTAEPAQELAVLIDLIIGDLQSWPGDAWLVLDDYHALMRSGEAEGILEELVSRTRLNVLITSRRRPTWATPRQIFYGEVVELGAPVLAMDDAEAKEVFGSGQQRSRELVAAAEGWPAFIALAALNDDITVPPSDLPSGSYEFLANEIFFSVDEDVQDALREIALAPRNHASLLRRLHPYDTAIRIQDESVRVGILSEAGDAQIELHPLFQQFLLKRSHDASTEAVDHAVARVWEVLTEDRLWDDAFAVLAAARRPQLLPQLFDRALDPLLEMGRTMSLRRWIDFAVANDIDAPIVKLAEAELALRAGTLTRAEAIATEAAGEFGGISDRAARSWCIAGQAAHLQSQEEVAIEYFRRATSAAESAEVRQVARWGELASSVDLELENAELVMRDVVANESTDPAGLVRRSNAQLIYELRFGNLGSLREAAMAKQVIDRVKDPIRRAGFWSVYSTALAVTAHYDAALEATSSFLEDARRYRVDFALPYAHAARAMAMLGLRRYGEATEALVEATDAATRTNDEHALANADAIRARLMLSQGRYEDAVACLEAAASEGMTRGMAGELLACRAVALACLSDPDYSDLAIAALKKTRTVETRVLVPVAHAIFKSLTNASDLTPATRSALDTATHSGSWDCFICGYRAHPEFLLPLRGDQARLSALAQVVRRAGDTEVLAPMGIAFAGRPRRLLSPRESEIHSLVAMGLTNREIAARLVISEATVKLHVHRVLEKLGVKTRTAAAAQYRAKQAQDRA
jgi:LuxR family maltose regulon positive regulatory protein